MRALGLAFKSQWESITLFFCKLTIFAFVQIIFFSYWYLSFKHYRNTQRKGSRDKNQLNTLKLLIVACLFLLLLFIVYLNLRTYCSCIFFEKKSVLCFEINRGQVQNFVCWLTVLTFLSYIFSLITFFFLFVLKQQTERA